jgi:hypothetical protein
MRLDSAAANFGAQYFAAVDAGLDVEGAKLDEKLSANFLAAQAAGKGEEKIKAACKSRNIPRSYATPGSLSCSSTE